jgi:beta-lactamase class A
MTRTLQTLLFFFLVTSCQPSGETAHPLEKEMERIIKGKDAVVGISTIGKDGKDAWLFNGDKRFPMQSVFKFHIALAVLAEVDKGTLSLHQEVVLEAEDMLPADIWSPLRDENPKGGIFTIERLIQYSVSQSDNTACDVLIRLIGTPKTVEDYIKSKGISDIAIAFNEQDMQAAWENMFQNWTTPKAASETLKLFYANEENWLSPSSHEFIWRTMKETETGKKRLRGQLPAETAVAHKTGWSGTNKETGITDAVNDIGVVFLPNGDHFFISAFVTQSSEDIDTNEKIISDLSRAAYDYYLNQGK